MKLEAYTVKDYGLLQPAGLIGRRKIKTPVREINLANVRDVLEAALAVHSVNAGEITYLYNYL